MNKADKKLIDDISSIIKRLNRKFGKNCPEININCVVCKKQLLVARLIDMKEELK